MDEREMDGEFELISVKPFQNIYIFSLFLSLSHFFNLSVCHSLSRALSLSFSSCLFISVTFSLCLSIYILRMKKRGLGWVSLDEEVHVGQIDLGIIYVWEGNGQRISVKPSQNILIFSLFLSLPLFLSPCLSFSLSRSLSLSFSSCLFISVTISLWLSIYILRMKKRGLGWVSLDEEVHVDQIDLGTIYGWERNRQRIRMNFS